MTVTQSDERTELLSTLAHHRGFLRYAAQGLTDEQANTRASASELTIAGIVKHVSSVERGWVRFIAEGIPATPPNEESLQESQDEFRMTDGETLAGLLDEYEAVARATEELVCALPSLAVAHPVPEAPWFAPGTTWSARRVLLHILAETSQHAGHADIIRESIDGQKTMG